MIYTVFPESNLGTNSRVNIARLNWAEFKVLEDYMASLSLSTELLVYNICITSAGMIYGQVSCNSKQGHARRR
jgi:hypothetical protein